MALDLTAWKASAVHELTEADTVFFDTNIVSRLYEAHKQRNQADVWKRRLEPIPAPRRVLNEVVLWELRRRFRGPDWEAWLHRYFQRVALDQRALRRFIQLFDHAFRPGLTIGGPADGFLAAHCLLNENRWVLATQDIDDFCLIPGLRLLVPPAASK